MKLVVGHESRLRGAINFAVIVFCIVSVVRREGVVRHTSPFDSFMINAFAPLQKGIRVIKDRISYVGNSYIFNISAGKENILMKQQIEGLRNEIFVLKEAAAENRRLKKLLDFGESISVKQVVARVVAWDASSDLRVIRIDRGSNDGVSLQDTVVTDEGLVGYIYRLTDNFADVLTVLDANNKVDGIISRIRSHGIVEGYSDRRCVMKYVTRTEPIILHDTVLTSGLGNIYPKGIKVGSVTRIEREGYGITQYLEISPAVDFTKIEEVLVLVSSERKGRREEWNILDNLDKGDKG